MLSILRWSYVDDAIAMANSVEYGSDRRHLDQRHFSGSADGAPTAGRLHLDQRRNSFHARAVPFGGIKNSGWDASAAWRSCTHTPKKRLFRFFCDLCEARI